MKHAETRVLSPRLSADDPAVRRVARAPEPVSPASGPNATVRRRVLNQSSRGLPDAAAPRGAAGRRGGPRFRREPRGAHLRRVRATRARRDPSRRFPAPSLTLSVSDDLVSRQKNAARNADLEDVFRRVSGLLRRARVTRPAWKRARGTFQKQRDHHEPLHRA